ncbi:MAG: type VI secretion system membrane subunit TssM [Marinagarivorans sp.]|nr:type VI secretion system membrane subunit TssM [Marinagarivorans sp.]
MKTMVRFFTNRLVISLIGLMLIAMLVWFAGPQIKFGDNNTAPLAEAGFRLFIIMAIVLLWVVIALCKQLLINKNNKSLVNDLQDSKQYAQQDMASEQAADEVAQLSDRFQSALGTLNKLKFQGRGRKKALYQLPWYIIVGPPGSGKTTVLVNSGLEFPLADQFGAGAVQGVGGTRNCDWWFTNEAVLIDTAGRYTTQDSHKVVDSSAWEGFLTLLKRNRRRRPINGAIVAISLQDLLMQTDEERSLHAKTIRTRLDELMTKLEIRFPVYLLFTKSDLVHGFSEFFEDLGKEEREQVWGVSLPNAAKPTQSPDFSYLSSELKKLSQRLNDRVLGRMHQERDPQRCGAIEGFPLQMDNLFQIAESFINRTFAQNRFEFQPYLRGVYFSSGTQDGTPIDRLMTSVSANFGFAREVAAPASGRGKSYFISRLFREVIFPESELVGANRGYERLIRFSQSAAYITAAAVTLGVVLLWSGSVTRNNLYMAEVKNNIKTFKDAASQSAIPTDVNRVLVALNALYSASSVYDQQAHPWLNGMGLYDGRVNQNADQLYQQALQEQFLPPLLKTMERVIQQGDPAGDLYSTFRLYMMFQVVDQMNKPMLQTWFENHWDQQLAQDKKTASELKQHLAALFELDISSVTLNALLVEQTRSQLLRVPIAQRIYSRIKADPQYNQRVDVLNWYGETVRNNFKQGVNTQNVFNIPVLFTLQGYKNLDLSPSSPLFANVADEQWVLADADSSSQVLINRDVDSISAQVRDFYLADYSNTWASIHSALVVNDFSSLQELNRALTAFVDPVYSPIIAILETAKTNTQLTPPVLDMAADKVQGGGKVDKALDYLAAKAEGTSVDKRFADLHALVQSSSRGMPPVSSVLLQIEALRAFVQDIALAPDTEQRAFEIAKARYQSNANSPVSTLRAYAKTTPEPLQRWLTSLADESWKIISQSAHSYVGKEWRARVYQPYVQALAGRYPLNPTATDELAVLDFSGFFKPQGTLDQFTTEFLDPFIDKRGNWIGRSVDGFSLGIPSSALAQLQRAASIRAVFFRQNPETPSITLELRPYFMNKDDALFTLDLGDQRLTYNHGPKFWKSITWSGDNEARRLRLIFEDLKGGQFDRSFMGPWAWFRLMDAAHIQSTPQSNVFLITFKHDSASPASDENARKIVFEGRVNSIHNPFKNELLNAFRCPESL